MLALCKYQKWKEEVKISEYQDFGDLILKSMAIAKFLKTENLTNNIWEFYIGQALLPIQPRCLEMLIHSLLKFWDVISFRKLYHCHSFQY